MDVVVVVVDVIEVEVDVVLVVVVVVADVVVDVVIVDVEDVVVACTPGLPKVEVFMEDRRPDTTMNKTTTENSRGCECFKLGTSLEPREREASAKRSSQKRLR